MTVEGEAAAASATTDRATPPPAIPLLGMMIDRSSFDETGDFCIDHDALEATEWAKEHKDGLSVFPPPVLMKNGKVRRRLRWRPRSMMKRRRDSPGDASVSGTGSVSGMSMTSTGNVSQTSRFSRKSVHSFASTETQVQSNTRKAKNTIFGRNGSSAKLPLPRPNYPDSFNNRGVSTIGTEGGMIQARMGQEKKKDVLLQPVDEVADVGQLEVVLPSKLAGDGADQDASPADSTPATKTSTSDAPPPPPPPEAAPTATPPGTPPKPKRVSSFLSVASRTPPKSPKKKSGMPPLFQQRRAQVTPERPADETKSMESPTDTKKMSPLRKRFSTSSMPAPDRKHDHQTIVTSKSANFSSEDDSIPLNVLSEADRDRQVDLRILRIPVQERRDTTNSSSRQEEDETTSSQRRSRGRTKTRSTKKSKSSNSAGRLSVKELRTTPPLEITATEETPLKSNERVQSPVDLDNSFDGDDDNTDGQRGGGATSPFTSSEASEEGVELEGFTDDEGGGEDDEDDPAGLDLLSTPSSVMYDIFAPLASASSGKFELRFSMSAPSPKTTSVALAKPCSPIARHGSSSGQDAPPLAMNVSEGENSTGASSCSSSPIPKAHTGPVDLDDGTFLEVEKNLQAILEVATEHLQQGEYAEALEVFEEILRGQLARYGTNHPRVGTAHHNIGIVHTKRGDYTRAISAYKRAVVVRKKTLGMKHVDVAASLAQLGVAYLEVDKQKKAITAFREALKIRRYCYGNRHHKVAKILNNIGCALYELDELEVAKVAFEEALQIQRHLLKLIPVDSLVNSHDQLLGIASTQCNIASIKLYYGEFDEALVELEEALLVQQCVLSDDHPIVRRTEESIAWVEKSRKLADGGGGDTADIVSRLTGLHFSKHILTALSSEDKGMSSMSPSSTRKDSQCQGVQALSVFDFLEQRFMQLHANLDLACGGVEPAADRENKDNDQDDEDDDGGGGGGDDVNSSK